MFIFLFAEVTFKLRVFHTIPKLCVQPRKAKYHRAHIKCNTYPNCWTTFNVMPLLATSMTRIVEWNTFLIPKRMQN